MSLDTHTQKSTQEILDEGINLENWVINNFNEGNTRPFYVNQKVDALSSLIPEIYKSATSEQKEALELGIIQALKNITEKLEILNGEQDADTIIQKDALISKVNALALGAALSDMFNVAPALAAALQTKSLSLSLPAVSATEKKDSKSEEERGLEARKYVGDSIKVEGIAGCLAGLTRSSEEGQKICTQILNDPNMQIFWGLFANSMIENHPKEWPSIILKICNTGHDLPKYLGLPDAVSSHHLKCKDEEGNPSEIKIMFNVDNCISKMLNLMDTATLKIGIEELLSLPDTEAQSAILEIFLKYIGDESKFTEIKKLIEANYNSIEK